MVSAEVRLPMCSDLLLRRGFLQVAALKKERSRFEHAVKINGEETDVECAAVGVRERDGEGVRQ